jgi:hypothetical protein
MNLCHDVIGVEPTATVTFKPVPFAVARGSTGMPEKAGQPARHALDVVFVTRDGIIAEPVLIALCQICNANMAFAPFPPNFGELTTQPFIVIVKRARVSIAAVARAGVASNQRNVRDRNIIAGDSFNEV